MRKTLLTLAMTVGLVAFIGGVADAQGSFGVVVSTTVPSENNVCIGMIHGQDGSYVHGNYDTLLCSGGGTRNTLGWTDGTAGYLIPANHCINEYDSNAVFIRTLCASGTSVQRFYNTGVSHLKTYILRQQG